MLGAAQDVLEVAGSSATAVSDLEDIWQNVIEADALVREATVAANEAVTEEAVKAARDQTQKAYDIAKASLSRLKSYAKKRTNMDLSAQVKYLTTRVDALGHALATSDALLAGDRATAATENDAYNASDTAAAALAEMLPADVGDIAEDAYAKKLKKTRDAYETARNRAIEADSLIRSYMD